MMELMQYAWPVSGITALCVGLAAFGFDLCKTLSVGNLRKPLQLVAGAAGAIYFSAWMNRPAGTPQMAVATGLITSVVALSVGLAALGFDLSKMLKLGTLRKPLQYVAGVAGAISLAGYFNLM